MKKTTNARNLTFPRSLVIICSLALLTVLCAVSIYAAEFTYGIYFEIDKNPIESVEIVAADMNGGKAPSELKRGEQVTLSSIVYPFNAGETVIVEKYKVIEGSDYATVKRGVLTVSENAPIGSVIEVIAEVDDVVSENSVTFTVVRTPVEEITLLNKESAIMVGASLKLETEVFPADATDKNVRYSIVSDTPCMRMSYSGVLSFSSSSVPEEVIAVTVRASSASDPTVYTDKTFAVTRPILEIKDASAELSEINQQCAYSFDTRLPYLAEIFGSSAVNYSIDADESVASVDINGLLFVSEYAPIGTEIKLTITSVDGERTHVQHLTVAPVFATEFVPVMLGQPDIVFPEGGYYLPGSVIEFDVVAFAPINVTEENKIFAVRVSDDSLAYVEGNKVIIRNTAEISVRDPKLTVTVYSQPNGLEEEFEISIFLPVEGVTATAKKDQLVAKHSYPLSDILGYVTTPVNASVRAVTYGAEGLDASVGVISDGVLIINENLPEGAVTVRLFVEIDGIRSNVVVLSVYKPAHNVTVEAQVNGNPIGDTDDTLPVSAVGYADTVTLITTVDGSVNETNIVIDGDSKELIDDNNIRLVRVSGSIAYYEFTLKCGLIDNGNMRPVIKLYATQDGVESDQVVIPIYIPNEKVLIKDLTVPRGEQVQLVPIQNSTEGEAKVAVEYRLSDEAVMLGVKLRDDGYIDVPRKIGGGTKFIVEYRAIETNGRENYWKEVACTVEHISDSSVNIFKGRLQSGFNIVYTTDYISSGKPDVQLNKYAPQIMVGRFAEVNIIYGSDKDVPITDFNLSIAADENGLVFEDDQFIVTMVDADTIKIAAKKDAKVINERSEIKITVKDGENISYNINLYDIKEDQEITVFDGFHVFRPLPENLTLEFYTMTKNGQSIYDLVKNKSVDDNTNYKIGDLKFHKLTSENGFSINELGIINISSLDISVSQQVKYTCEQKYNNTTIISSGYSTLNIQSVSMDGRDGKWENDVTEKEIVAVSGLKGVKGSAIIPQRPGYNFAGFMAEFDNYCAHYALSNCEIMSDYHELVGTDKKLLVAWSPISYKVTIKEDHTNVTVKRTDTNAEVNDGDMVPCGTVLSISVSANKGYKDAWVTTSTGNNTMPAGELEITSGATEEGGCVAKGTLITLADGTQKPVEELDGTEMLLVWDMFKGEFTAAPIMINISYSEGEFLVTRLYFEDGNELDIIDEHGLFDATVNAFVFLTAENAHEYIGHSFNMQYTDENGKLCWKTVKLVDTKNEYTYTAAYSPVTYGYLCCYVDGILSMPGETQGLCNYFTVDGETMKYDEAQMQADIELYGLFTYEEFASVIPPELFDAVNGRFVKVAVAKGITTEEALMKLIMLYAGFFEMEGGEQ